MEQGIWDLNPGLVFSFSEIGYFLLPSCDMTELLFKRCKNPQNSWTNWPCPINILTWRSTNQSILSFVCTKFLLTHFIASWHGHIIRIPQINLIWMTLLLSDYENLFNQLNTVQGSLDMRCAFIKDVMQEASRFKKKVLIQMLEQFEKSMVQSEGQRRNSSMSAYNSNRW